MGYLLILIKTAANIGESVLIKQYNKRSTKGGMFFTGIISLFSALFFLVTDKGGFTMPLAALPYAFAFGIIYCAAYLLTFVALMIGPFTLSTLIISYSLVFPILYGIFMLGDSIGVFTIIGFALLAASLFLIRADKRENENGFSVKWLVSIIIVAAGNGALAIIQKMQQLKFDNVCNNEFMVISIGLSAAVLLIGGCFKDRKYLKEILIIGTPYAGLAGILNGVTNLLTLFVNNLIAISISSPLSAGAKIVLSFISSKVFFHEKFNRRQIIGVIIGALALVALNI